MNVQKYHDFFVHAKHFKQQKRHCTNKIISRCIAIFKLILNSSPVDLTLYSFFLYLFFHFLRITETVILIFSKITMIHIFIPSQNCSNFIGSRRERIIVPDHLRLHALGYQELFVLCQDHRSWCFSEAVSNENCWSSDWGPFYDLTCEINIFFLSSCFTN